MRSALDGLLAGLQWPRPVFREPFIRCTVKHGLQGGGPQRGDTDEKVRRLAYRALFHSFWVWSAGDDGAKASRLGSAVLRLLDRRGGASGSPGARYRPVP